MRAEPSSLNFLSKINLDSGPQTKQLENKVTLMMKHCVFGHGTTTSLLGGPHHSGPENSRKKGKGKRKSKGEARGTGRAFLGEQREQKPELWSEKDSTCWFKGKRGKKGFSKGNESLRKGGLRTSPSQKGSSSDYDSHKGKVKDQKGKDKECVIQQSGFSASENSVEEGQVHPSESVDWYSNCFDDSSNSACRGTTAWDNSRHFAWFAPVPLDLNHHPTRVGFDLDCTQSIASKSAIWWFQKCAFCIMIKRQDSVPAISLLCLPTLKQKRVGKVV